MDAKILFNKILDLAIRGRLTEQLESDGSAQDLIDQIENEKKREIEEYNKANPKKTQKKYVAPKPIPSEDYPFDIPENWRWVRLGDICQTIGVGGDKPNICSSVKDENNTIPIYSNGVSDDGLYGYTNQFTVSAPAITIAGRGTIGFTKLRKEPFYPIVRLIYLLFFSGIDYLFFEYVISVFVKGIGLGSSIPQLTVPMIKPLLLPLPPLSEQKRIVAKLEEIKSKIDKYIENEEAINTDCDILRNKVLDLAIKGGLTEQLESDGSAQDLIDQIENEKKREIEEYNKANPKKTQKKYVAPKPIPSEDIPFEIPENWKWVRLGEVLFEMESTKPQGESFKYIDIDAINNKQYSYSPKVIEVSKAPSRASRKVSKGDVLFSMVRPYLRNITLVIEDDCIASTGFYVCKPFFIDSKYLFNFLITEFAVLGLNEHMNGDKSPSINNDDLKNFLFPLPPLSEQKRIVGKLESLFDKIDKIKNGIPKSEKVFKFPETEGQKMPVAAEGGTQFSGKGR